MKITVHLGFKSTLLGLVAAACVLLPAWLVASQVGTLHSFAGGTTASASQVNDNFDAVKDAVDDNFGRITEWVEFPMIISATGTAPAKATQVVHDQAFWRRVGDSMEIHYAYRHDNNAGAAIGAGVYLFGLPAGYQIDASKIRFTSSDVVDGIVGPAAVLVASSSAHGYVKVHDTTHLKMIADRDDAQFLDQSVQGTATDFGLHQPSVRYSFRAVVPIVGWH